MLGLRVAGAGDVNNDGISDRLVAYEGGAIFLTGEADGISSTYRNRMRAGEDELAVAIPGSLGLGDIVKRDMAGVLDGSYSKPVSGVRIQFVGGGFGADLVEPSTQEVTIFREASPDIASGDFDPVRDAGTTDPDLLADDEKWMPAKVFWEIETDRSGFSDSVIEFFYRPEDVEGLDIENVGVFYAKNNEALDQNTPWSWTPFTHDPDRRVFTVSRTHPSTPQADVNGYYALVQAQLITELGGGHSLSGRDVGECCVQRSDRDAGRPGHLEQTRPQALRGRAGRSDHPMA